MASSYPYVSNQSTHKSLEVKPSRQPLQLEQGQEPACAEACPTGALIFGDEEEMAQEKRRQSAQRLVIAQAESVLKG